MIEHTAQQALNSAKQIERVLRQVGDHQDVSAVEVGNALAPLQAWVDTLEELKKVSREINISDVEATEKFLGELEKQGGCKEDFASLRRILNQQKYFAGLQKMELQAIQESLVGTRVSFGVEKHIVVGDWLQEKGYVLYAAHGGNYEYRKKLQQDDSWVGIYKLYKKRRMKSAFWGLVKTEQEKEWAQRVSLLMMFDDDCWGMKVDGKENVPEAVLLARSLSEFVNKQIGVRMVSEKGFAFPVDSKNLDKSTHSAYI